MSRYLSRALAGLAAILLPASLRDWGRAMAREAETIPRPAPRLAFALGCVAAVLRQALAFHFVPREPPIGGEIMISQRHRVLPYAILCAMAATGLGFAYMSAAGAPLSYLAINGAALILGLLAIGIAREGARLVTIPGGFSALALSAALLSTSLFGITADGATRWVSAGGVPLQLGLIVIPLLGLLFARYRDNLSTLAVAIAALALAMQPDRAMAASLAAAMAAMCWFRPGRNAAIGLVAALAGAAVTLARPDPSQAMPFVDQIFYSAFDVHLLAGLAVLAGSALLILPAIIGFLVDPENRAAYAVFGAAWLAAIVAAALGNYPTPLVGYSASAILGYMLSLIGLPKRSASSAERHAHAASRAHAEDGRPQLREGLPAAG